MAIKLGLKKHISCIKIRKSGLIKIVGTYRSRSVVQYIEARPKSYGFEGFLIKSSIRLCKKDFITKGKVLRGVIV